MRPHGQLTTYVNDRCRCPLCSAASRDYACDRYRQRAYGRIPALVPVAEVADHLRWLSLHGIGWERAADLTGLAHSTVSAILYPYRRRRGITPRVAQLILDLLPTMDNAAAAALISAAGTQRRLGALMLQGHTLTAIQFAAGRTDLGRVLTRDQVTAATARAVRDYYDLHWSTPAIPTSAHAAGIIARTIARAEAAGYLPALVWDDERLDDPTATPDRTRLRTSTPRTRIHLEDIEFLARHGATWDEIQDRTGAIRNSVEVACDRAGRKDLVARITSNRRVAA